MSRLGILSSLCALAFLAACGGTGSDSLFSSDGGGGSTSDSAPGAGIFGRLVDETDAAVAGASIELVDASDNRLAGPVTTAVDGTFDLPFGNASVPEDAVLVIRPPNRPEARAGVTVPPGARVEFLLTVDPQGAAMVTPVLAPPVGAPSIGDSRGRAVLLAIDAAGDSAPFLLDARGQFASGSSEFRLVYRAFGDRQWTVGSDAPIRQVPQPLPLRLRSRAAALHGRRLEVRAMAIPPGALNGVTMFTQPLDIGPQVTISPEPVVAFPIATRYERLGPAGLLPNAVIARGSDGNAAQMAAADMRQLGLTDGALAQLSHLGRSVRITLRASDDPALALATLLLPGGASEHLGLALSTDLAGYTVGLTAAVGDGGPTRPGGWGQ